MQLLFLIVCVWLVLQVEGRGRATVYARRGGARGGAQQGGAATRVAVVSGGYLWLHQEVGSRERVASSWRTVASLGVVVVDWSLLQRGCVVAISWLAGMRSGEAGVQREWCSVQCASEELSRRVVAWLAGWRMCEMWRLYCTVAK